jgi:hypothetical protein
LKSESCRDHGLGPLDLYYMPYTHSLVAAVLWSLAALLAYRVWRRGAARAGVLVRCGVLALGANLVVHRPDLPCMTTR